MPKYVSAVQMDCKTGDMKLNTRKIIRLLYELKAKEPETVLAVYPELCLYGYGSLEAIVCKYTKEDVELCLNEIVKACIETQIDAVVGAPHIENGAVKNSLYFLSCGGEIIHVYSKTHLIAMEKGIISAGSHYGICQTSLGKAGFLICYDTAFAETARLYAKAGADFLIVSAAWELPYTRQWQLSIGGRSFDNSLPVIASNRVGVDGKTKFFGQSLITDSMGEIIAGSTDDKEGFITARADKLFNHEKRKEFGSQIKEMREEIYQMDAVKIINI